MKNKVLIMILSLAMICSLGACGSTEDENAAASATEETAVPEEESTEESVSEEADAEVPELEITYLSCTADELMQECVDNLDSAKEKYLDQYVEITGVLREIELDESANPVGKVVRMDTSVEVTNAACNITGITWDEEDVPLEEFQKAMEEMQPGDTVTMKVYVDSLDQDFYDYYFDLYGVEKQ